MHSLVSRGAVGCLIGMASMASAGAIPTGSSSPDLVRALTQLADPDFTTREQAAHRLEALGPAILPQLRLNRRQQEPEAARRLETIIDHLERQAAFQPQRVSLHLARYPLASAFQELSQQTGYTFDVPANFQRDQFYFTFHLHQVPFWEALDQVCASANLEVSAIDRDRQIHLICQENHAPFVCYRGPLRLMATRLQDVRVVDFTSSASRVAGGQAPEALTFHLNVSSEPRLPMLQLGTPRLIEARDDQNRSMLPVPGDSDDACARQQVHFWQALDSMRNYSLDTQVALSRPSRTSRVIKHLQGVLPVTVLAEERPEAVIDEVLKAKGAKLSVEHEEATIEEVDRAVDMGPGVYRLRLRFRGQPAPSQPVLSSSLAFPQSARLSLQDGQGRCYEQQQLQSEPAADGSIVATILFNDGGQKSLGTPSRLVCYRWIEREYQVPFDFKEVPLP